MLGHLRTHLFKLGMIIDMTKLYSLFQFGWPWCLLKVIVSQESENLCSYSVVKLHEATQIFMMVDYAREMTVMKSCVANMNCLNICSSCYDLKLTLQQNVKFWLMLCIPLICSCVCAHMHLGYVCLLLNNIVYVWLQMCACVLQFFQLFVNVLDHFISEV